MDRVSSLEVVQNANRRIRGKGKGFLTNYFGDVKKTNCWIDLGLLFSIESDDYACFFKKDSGFYSCYYLVSNAVALHALLEKIGQKYPNDTFVFDNVGTKESLTEVAEVFESKDYARYVQLHRMSRLEQQQATIATNASVEFATKNDLLEVKELLARYFDPLAEQLPLDGELLEWIEQNGVVVFREANTIIGFAIFEIVGITGYLRYWFTHPLHRNKKVGSSLLHRFFEEARLTKRQLFWVISDNHHAIVRYEHYGFKSENLVDIVFVNNKALKYEKSGD